MRLRQAKLIVAIIVVANLILFYYSWKSTLWKTISSSLITNDLRMEDSTVKVKTAKDKLKNANKHIRKSITIVFRNIYPFENDLKGSIDSILDVVPNINIFILQDSVPYPPLNYERNRSTIEEENTVSFINLSFDPQKSTLELNPLLRVKTKYVLFMPDSVRLSSKIIVQKILREINSIGLGIRNRVKGDNSVKQRATRSAMQVEGTIRHILVIPFVGNIKSFSSCTQIDLDLPNWTIQYTGANSTNCHLYLQKHAILLDVELLKTLPDPLKMPFPEMLYIQSKIANIPLTVFSLSFQDGRRLFASYHTKQRRAEIRRRQFKEMYKKFQIKRIIRKSHKIIAKTDSKNDNNGISQQHNILLDAQFSSSNISIPLVTEFEVIGCERTTKSCVGTVYNRKPWYLFLGKHTPPCCYDKLVSTFNHVLEEIENVGIRHWLDGTALKTAIETASLSPDAYEIDISFNVNDLERSNSMKKSQNKPYIDNDGFYWIKATDGYYFRVQFSKINQIGVNLLPHEIKGNEVRPSGFFGWKAKEFSAEFLHPMSMVLFIGKNVMCPNNVREYLEFKNIK